MVTKLQEDLASKTETINQLQRVSNNEFKVQTNEHKIEEINQMRVHKKMKGFYNVREVKTEDYPPL